MNASINARRLRAAALSLVLGLTAVAPAALADETAQQNNGTIPEQTAQNLNLRSNGNDAQLQVQIQDPSAPVDPYTDVTLRAGQ